MNDAMLSTMTLTETKRLDSVRFLTRMLLISGCCNLVALLIGFYGCFAGSFWLLPHHLHRLNPFEGRIAHSRPSLSNTLQHFHVLSIHQLIECVSENSCVEEGYSIRDLALSYLVWQHQFDLARAMQQLPPIHSTTLHLSIDGTLCTLPLYLALSDAHYDAILAFGRKEQWPITPAAMFALLKNPQTAENLALKESFCLCAPFQLLYKSLSGSQQEEQESQAHEGWNMSLCLSRILEGDWQQCVNCLKAVCQHASSIHLARQTFLAFYPPEKALLQKESVGLGTEVKTELLLAKTAESVPVPSQQIAKEKTKAKEKETAGQGKIVEKAVAGTQASAKRKSSPSAAYSIPKLYVVRTGDSLWKIARAFQVDVEKLKAYNALQSDRLHPGLNLLIP